MYGKVTALYDIHKINIPPEYLDTTVTAAEINAQHEYLAFAYSEQVREEIARVGDCAMCVCESGPLIGRTIPLYPGKELPQALEAEKAVTGRRIGDIITSEINGEPCVLRLEEVIRCKPAAVDDELISRLKMDGIKTLAEYDTWYRAEKRAEKREKNSKVLGTYLLRELTARSEFSYDLPALETQMLKEYADLQGKEPPLKADEFRRIFTERVNQNLVLTELCLQHGVTVTEDDVKDNIDQMLEMYCLTGEETPDRETLTKEYIQAEYYTKGMEILLREISGEAEEQS